MSWIQNKWNNLKGRTIHGRLNRWRFFTWGIGYALFFYIADLIQRIIFSGVAGLSDPHMSPVSLVLSWILSGLGWLVSLFLEIGRFHDLNWSGWMIVVFNAIGFAAVAVILIFWFTVSPAVAFIALLVAGVIAVVFSLYLLFRRGTVGPNRFGPDPLEEEKNTPAA